MSIATTWQVESTSSAVTEKLAARLGKVIKGGEVIELVSDLGGGKTTFVRGFVRGMGSTDHVASPTFTISRVYTAGRRTIHHFDFYRLHEAGLMGEELAEVIHDPRAVVIVEWADAVKDVLPAERLTITMRKTADNASADDRQMTFSAPPSLHYLLQAVQT